jgi:small subunit ribosomal protein S19e
LPTPKDVTPELLIKKLADYMKNNVPEAAPPSWAQYVKTGVQVERLPQDPDWWYTRSASLLRKVYLEGPIGISRLTKEYGGRVKKKHHSEHFKKGSGAITRNILKQLEKAKLVLTVNKKGRIVTDEGKGLLNRISKDAKTELEKTIPELQKY